MQYTAVIKNLIGLKPQRKAMYCTTGLWSLECITEAKKYGNIIEVFNTDKTNYSELPDPNTWNIDPEASYLHITCNETVNGFEITEDNFPWHKFPKDLVVVGDMSSNIATRPINWNRYSVVYAGAQKNLGPAGCTVVIAKRSLFGKADKDIPVMADWALHERGPGGYYNTPPCWSIYMTGLNCSYMNQKGGIPFYNREAEIKSGMLYSLIDNSNGYYVNRVNKSMRSRINCIFKIEGNRQLEPKLIAEAEKNQIVTIAGHPTQGGLRISMYNAMPIGGVVHLC